MAALVRPPGCFAPGHRGKRVGHAGTSRGLCGAPGSREIRNCWRGVRLSRRIADGLRREGRAGAFGIAAASRDVRVEASVRRPKWDAPQQERKQRPRTKFEDLDTRAMVERLSQSRSQDEKLLLQQHGLNLLQSNLESFTVIAVARLLSTLSRARPSARLDAFVKALQVRGVTIMDQFDVIEVSSCLNTLSTLRRADVNDAFLAGVQARGVTIMDRMNVIGVSRCLKALSTLRRADINDAFLFGVQARCVTIMDQFDVIGVSGCLNALSTLRRVDVNDAFLAGLKKWGS